MTALAPDSRAARPVTPLGLLAASLQEITERLEAADVDPDVLDRLRGATLLAAGLDPYIGRCTSPESAGLQRVSTRTAAEDWRDRAGEAGRAPLEQEMLSGHVEGALLRFLVSSLRATTVLEIGMFTGYSALAMAEALPADGRLVTCEVDTYVAAFARDGFQGAAAADRIEIRVGPALETLRLLAAAGEVFDLVFIDADKPGYAGYLDAILDSRLLAAGGVIAVDNTLMQGQPWTGAVTANGRAIAAFNAGVANDPRLEQVLLPLRDGLTLIRRVEA